MRDPTPLVVRNLLDLARVTNGLSREAEATFAELFAEILAALVRHDPTAVAGRFRRGRIEKLLERTEALADEAFTEWAKELRQELAELARQQSGAALSVLDRSLTGVGVSLERGRLGVNLAKRIIDSDPFEGDLFRKWVEATRDATVRNVRRQVQLGLALNEPIGDIVRRVRGRSVGRGRFAGGVLDTTTRKAAALVRTAVTDIANRAHEATYRENADVLEGVRFTATLDSRTTIICASNDGRVFALDDEEITSGRLRPPLHFGCRSVLTPVVDWAGLGVAPPADSFRASRSGPVPAGLDYDEWLRTQPRGTVVEVLGRRRADLFLGGKLNLREMVRNDRTVVRVSELADAA